MKITTEKLTTKINVTFYTISQPFDKDNGQKQMLANTIRKHFRALASSSNVDLISLDLLSLKLCIRIK